VTEGRVQPGQVFAVAAGPDTVKGWLEAGEALERLKIGARAIGLRDRRVELDLQTPRARRQIAALLEVQDPVQAVLGLWRDAPGGTVASIFPTYAFH
jgi:hypothetical protein